MNLKSVPVWIIALTLFMSACTNEILDLDGADGSVTNSSANVPKNFISMQQAKNRLISIVAELNAKAVNPASRLPYISSPAKLKGVALDSKMCPLTRGSDESNADCYVFRLDNDMFAIMSATENRPELLAIGSGYPNFEDSTANLPNPNYWNPAIPVDTVPQINDQEDTVFTKIIKTEYSYVVQDLIPVKWGNKSPFNDYLQFVVKNLDNGMSINVHAAVGCVAVATGQIMTANKLRGAYYQDHVFDWDLLSQYKYGNSFMMNSAARDQVATLFKDLTSNGNIEVSQWGPDVTWAIINTVPRALRNFHFKESGSRRSFDFETVKSELIDSIPVCFDASGGTDSIIEWGRHFWACHGLLKATLTIGVYSCPKNSVTPVDPTLLYTKTEDAWYLQMNWGWDSEGDGYYLAKFDDFLNNIKGPDIPEEGTEPSAGDNIYFPNTTWITYGFRFR